MTPSIQNSKTDGTIQYDLGDKLKGKWSKLLSQNTEEMLYHKVGEKDGDPEGGSWELMFFNKVFKWRFIVIL